MVSTTSKYDVAEHLRTEKEMEAYRKAYMLTEEDGEFLAACSEFGVATEGDTNLIEVMTLYFQRE